MSHHHASCGRLTRVAGCFALVFAASTSVAVAYPGTGSAPMASFSASTMCSNADARTLATPRADACKNTLSTSQASSPQTYTYQTLDYPGAALTIIWGLNDRGDMAGQYSLPGGTSHAMVYRHGRFAPLDPDMLGEYFSAGGGPDDFGTTFGGYADASGLQHGYVIRHGKFETVDFAGHLNSNVDGVSMFGRILGVYWDADGSYHGVLRLRGHDTPINVANARDTYPLGINSTGEVVGYWDTNPLVTHGFYRSVSGQISNIDVPDAAATAAFAINEFGQITGYYASATGSIHGFVETRSQFQQLDVPGAVATIATAINNFGVVAGEYFDATGKRHGFVATPVMTARRNR